MTTVALYARVSSKNQAQNNTIESQIAELKRRIAVDGHELLKEYTFTDDGRNGSNLEREGLKELLRKVAEGKINKIYIYSLDRLSRDGRDQRDVIDECKRAQVEIISLDCKIDDTPSSDLLVDVKGAVARHELRIILERSMRGKLHAAREGRVSAMSNAPYGLQYIRKHVKGGEGKFEINEEEAKVVREVFMWIGEERISIREVVRRLEERSIRTQTGKEIWHPSTIHKMLKNPAYKGQAAYGKTKAGPVMLEVKAKKSTGRRTHSTYSVEEENWIYIPVPKIVDEELFNIVQKQLIENKQRARVRQGKETYLLQKLVGCKCCGRAYCGCRNGSKTKESVRAYYACLGNRSFFGNKACTNRSVYGEALETVIWEKIKSLLKDPGRMMQEHQRRILEHKNDESSDEKFARRKSQLEQRRAKLMEDYYVKENTGQEKYISEEAFKQTIKKIEQHLKEIEAEKKKGVDKKALQKRMSLITNSIKGFYSSTKSELEQPDWQTKRSLIRMFVRQVDIGFEEIDVVLKIGELDNPTQNGQNQEMAHYLKCRSTGMTKRRALG